jgi:bla regulator protein blaR1
MPGNTQITITGRVIDESGHPIPFASIHSFKTRGQGTAADYEGNFRINDVPNHDTLICSHINYETVIEEIQGNNKVIFCLAKKPIKSTSLILWGEYIPGEVALVKDTNKIIKKDSLLKEDEVKIFESVEIPARFGDKPLFFQHYIERNINLPVIRYDPSSDTFDREYNFDGRLVIHFTVDKSGKVVDPFIIKGINDSLDNIMMRALITMPRWYPAIQNGRFIASEQEISIQIKLRQKGHKISVIISHL